MSLCAVLVVPSCFSFCNCDDGRGGAPDVLVSDGLVVEQESLAQSPRTVDYRWYGFFDVPLGDWWEKRWEAYGVDDPQADSSPYLVRHYYDAGNFDTFSGARLNVTGRELPEINTTYDPQFLPFLSGDGGPRGGNAMIDWYMQYLSSADYPMYNPLIPEADDGWLVILNGTVALDMDAAMAVLGVPSDAWSDFGAWWSSNQAKTESDYVDWLTAEGNGDSLDIFPMYEYPFTVLQLNLDASREGDEVVLTYDMLSWGLEALMTRWLDDSFMPTEWWLEDMTFRAQIGPVGSDLDIDSAVAYAVKAWETEDTWSPCWIWQGMLQDCFLSSPAHPYSAFDPYWSLQHVSHSPGCPSNGEMVDYEYAPGCFNLSAGENLTFEWPEGDIMFLEHVEPFVTNNISSPAEVKYAEPMPVEMPGYVGLDADLRTLTFEGPMDFWTWSRSQDDHENLSAEWDRLGRLPWGAPYFDISMADGNAGPFAYLTASHDPEANVSSVYILDATSSSDAEDAASELQFRWDLDGDGAWDIDWGATARLTHDFETLGEHLVVMEAMDTDGASDTSRETVSITDIEPPVTTAVIIGVEGLNGWYLSGVLVNLSAQDGSDLGCTVYRLDEGEWSTYVDEIEVVTDAAHCVEFYSSDCCCNVETACAVEFGVDRVDPLCQFVSSAETYVTSDFAIFWTRSDNVSGVNRSEVSIDGQRYVSVGPANSYSFIGMVEGAHTVALRVFDNAGNVAEDTYAFTVTLSDDEDDAVPPADNPTSLALYVGLGVLVAAVLVAAIILLRRKS